MALSSALKATIALLIIVVVVTVVVVVVTVVVVVVSVVVVVITVVVVVVATVVVVVVVGIGRSAPTILGLYFDAFTLPSTHIAAIQRYTFRSCLPLSGTILETSKLLLKSSTIGHHISAFDFKIPHLSLNLLDLTPRAVLISHHFLQCAMHGMSR
ncbi:hypothetical protein Tco_0428179 [Tanacetum coccineum]